MTLRLIILALAFLCTAAHSQTCSGGTDGGMDATGDQCAVEDAVDLALPVTTRVPVRTDRTADAVPQQKDAGATTAVTVPPAMVVPVAVLPALVRSAEPDSGDDQTCSGGADGGMDATGNECAQATDSTPIDLARGPRR